MIFPIIIASGILMQICLAAYLSIRAVRGKAWTKTYLCIAVFLLVCAFLSTSLLVYNYSFLKGATSIERKEYGRAIAPLRLALTVRRTLYGLNQVFDKKVAGVPLFFASESLVRMRLAEAYTGLNDPESAIREYEQIIARNKADFYATASIAEAYFRLKEYDKARVYFQQIKKIDPGEKNADYYYFMGKAYMVSLEWERAEWYFAKSEELGCKNPVLKACLAFVRKQCNREDKSTSPR